jgi:hypothetical protein
MAAIVERANSLFGPEKPPADGDERGVALAAITGKNEAAWDALDRAFCAYPDDIADLLVRHFGLSSVT